MRTRQAKVVLFMLGAQSRYLYSIVLFLQAWQSLEAVMQILVTAGACLWEVTVTSTYRVAASHRIAPIKAREYT